MEDGRQARSHVDRSLALKGAGNLAAEFHDAGVKAAAGAAVFSGAMAAVDNMVAVIEGKKEPGEAIKDLVKATGRAAALSYFSGGAVSVISHSLSASSNSLARMLGQAGVPGKVVAAVLSTAGIIKNYIYDYNKAATVKPGYMPDIEKIYESKSGICYDYSVLFASMLRSQGIPAKVVKGSSTLVNEYHAWNEVFIDGNWIIVDTTVDAAYSASKAPIATIKSSNQYTKTSEI